MIRSSTNELLTPYKELEQEFRSSRRHFKTLSLEELRSPDFNLLSDQEYSKEEFAETMAETMEQYMSKTRADYGSRVARPKIENKDNFELKGQFLKELRTNTFIGLNHKDANKHIEKVLEIVDLFHIPNITIDQVMLRAFPMSLTRAASRWLRNKPTDENLYQAWEQFKEILMKCPQHYLTEMQEVILFYNGLGIPTRQILNLKGAIPSKTADTKIDIQEMVEYSQKWRNRTFKSRSTETSNGLAAIQAQLNNLGREIKKVNEKVYDAQVGCEQCKGPYYTKDCPLKEEGKTLEEAYYTQFGASVSVLPLLTYLNLGLGELAHTKLTIELTDMTVKYPKGIAKNVLVRIGKFVFPVDFIILDMPEDIKVPLILGRPFLSTARAKIDNEPIELRRNQGDNLIPTIEEGEVIKEFRTRDEDLDNGIDDYPSYCDYKKKIHIDCAHNLKFSCMIGSEFTHANFFPLLYVNVMSKKFHNSIMKDKMVYKKDNVVGALTNVPIFVGNFSVVTNFAVLENMDAYRDEGMGDVIVGEPFLREVGIKARRFEGTITLTRMTKVSVNMAYSLDYLSKWVESKALPTNDARVVVKFLKSLFARFGTPRAIISYRETYVCNDKFAKVMSKYEVTHRLSTAYHLQTSGQVKVSNRGLKRILERTVGENQASWSKKLDDALWVFKNAYKTPIGCTPYKLVYGKSCHLPIDLKHKAYWALKYVNFDLKTAGNHQKLQLNELRDQAYENSLIYKEKIKKIHDSKIKNRIFNVGDRVLLFNSRLKIFSGKLKTYWSGPFTITKVFPYGTVELSQPDGPNFKVNGHRVKHYFGGEVR
uniref:Reverse transcriptase domain-containing protein n=1 Tax=Tanacetum cinerariifolium TaxID=118510 RepID=A0A6L2N9B6_TANCI|nr:reverse transcriptase domain-containing protein [Tanacetum cinerariifolium]